MKNTAEFAKRQGRKAPKSVLQHYCISSLRLSRCKHSDYYGLNKVSKCQTHFEFSFRYGWHICSCYGRNINQLPSSYSTCSLDGIHEPDVFFEKRCYCHKFLSLVINLCENDNNQKHMPRYGGQRRMLSLSIILSRLYSMTNSISVMSPVP